MKNGTIGTALVSAALLVGVQPPAIAAESAPDEVRKLELQAVPGRDSSRLGSYLIIRGGLTISHERFLQLLENQGVASDFRRQIQAKRDDNALAGALFLTSLIGTPAALFASAMYSFRTGSRGDAIIWSGLGLTGAGIVAIPITGYWWLSTIPRYWDQPFGRELYSPDEAKDAIGAYNRSIEKSE